LSLPGRLGKQATCYVGANSQLFLFFLFFFTDSSSKIVQDYVIEHAHLK